MQSIESVDFLDVQQVAVLMWGWLNLGFLVPWPKVKGFPKLKFPRRTTMITMTMMMMMTTTMKLPLSVTIVYLRAASGVATKRVTGHKNMTMITMFTIIITIIIMIIITIIITMIDTDGLWLSWLTFYPKIDNHQYPHIHVFSKKIFYTSWSSSSSSFSLWSEPGVCSWQPTDPSFPF